MNGKYPKIKPVGDCSVLIEYEEEVSPEVNLKVLKLAHCIEKQPFHGITEVVPAYRSLMVFFDPFKTDVKKISDFINALTSDAGQTEMTKPRLFKIPTVYGSLHGPDLERVSEYTKLSQDEVVQLFASKAYLVYCLGFLCSLAYLGGVPKILEVPRLTTPRLHVPAGSVGFAGQQANILPIDQPSGFNYIGRTFVMVYDPRKFPPTLFRPGDYVQCPPASEEEAKWAGEKDLEDFIEGI